MTRLDLPLQFILHGGRRLQVVQANPVWAETELVNASEVRGNIVLIERGKTPFVEKARARPPCVLCPVCIIRQLSSCHSRDSRSEQFAAGSDGGQSAGGCDPVRKPWCVEASCGGRSQPPGGQAPARYAASRCLALDVLSQEVDATDVNVPVIAISSENAAKILGRTCTLCFARFALHGCGITQAEGDQIVPLPVSGNTHLPPLSPI
jgi:hypothetical protein